MTCPMPKLLRRVLTGFAAGAAAGWFAGLLRTPEAAPADSSADAALRLPQQEFGDPPGDPAEPVTAGEQEGADLSTYKPVDAAEPPVATPKPERAEPAAPRSTRRRRPATPDPAQAAADALRAGTEAARGKLRKPAGGASSGSA